MPTDAEHVRLSGRTGSDQHAIKMARLTQPGGSEKSGDGESAPHIIVGPPASERFDVAPFTACSHPAAGQLGRTGERIRATHAAGGIGRRGQFGDQRRAVRSRQSQRAQRPQRHRQRVEDPAAWYKLSAAAARLRTHQFITVTRGSALRGRVTAHHQRGSG